MRWGLWLSQPNTARRLNLALRIGAGGCCCWALGAAYFFWSLRSALAQEQHNLATQRKQAQEIARNLYAKRNEAKQAESLLTADPAGVGSIDFTEEVAWLAREARVRIVSERIGGGGADTDPNGAATGNNADAVKQALEAVQKKADPRPPAADNRDAAKAPAAPKSEWKREVFEVEVHGTYHALSLFLNRLAESHRVVEFTSMHFSPSHLSKKTDRMILQLKLTGTVYGLAGKR